MWTYTPYTNIFASFHTHTRRSWVFCAAEWIRSIILVWTYLIFFRVEFFTTLSIYRFIKLISLSFNKLNYVSCYCATCLWSPIRLYVFRILVPKKRRLPWFKFIFKRIMIKKYIYVETDGGNTSARTNRECINSGRTAHDENVYLRTKQLFIFLYI